jgi:lysine biosynthesis protein LysW
MSLTKDFYKIVKMEGIKMAVCPVCGVKFSLSIDAEKGEFMTCKDCGSELEVTGSDRVAEAPQEEEDWEE